MAVQQIFRIRREYNEWVADETREDYALRYAPRRFRKWSIARVANTALGGASFLALEAIGAAIALKYGFVNALWAIGFVALVVFATGLPISYCAARHKIDMDLLTRGAGFGYMGSTVTSLIYAGFTFIFFALETAILASALHLLWPLPLALWYLICSLAIVPLVARGVTLISRLHAWTQPLWLALLVLPYLLLAWREPALYGGFARQVHSGGGFDLLLFGAATTVAFSLVVQIGEQVDYLRFLPERTLANRRAWWAAVVLAGPGWIAPGALKMVGGAFLAWLLLEGGAPVGEALDPTRMYLHAFGRTLDAPTLALVATVVFVVVSQVKINVTNAYAGSLAWSNIFARLTHSHPGRVVWLVFNVAIALLLMTLGVFQALDTVLGLYSHVAAAWIGALVADLTINKRLGLAPPGIEFKRAHLYDLNPVGLGAMGMGVAAATVAFSGALGAVAQAFAPLLALVLAFAAAPVIAWATGGRWYLARVPSRTARRGRLVVCGVCEKPYEAEDTAHCPAYAAPICSLCCTLDARCHDRCKRGARAEEQVHGWLRAVLPARLARRVHVRLGGFMLVLGGLALLAAAVLALVYLQEASALDAADRARLHSAFIKVGALLLLPMAVASWWMVLGAQARRLAQQESDRQTERLTREIDAHQRTDAALQRAKEAAEAANQAKTRFVAGLSHELRTPLGAVLGYAERLLQDAALPPGARHAVQTIAHSGEHLRGMVDELLDLARIEADRLQLAPAPLALHAFVAELADMVAPDAQARGLHFAVAAHPDLPARVRADAQRLRQVLLNLLGNAMRFTPEGGRITLHAQPDAAAGGLRFVVSDTGVGIDAADLERIFEPFVRGAHRPLHGEAGAGLGLAISERLARLMGGQLHAASQPGAGSAFTLRLPLPVLADAAAPAPPALAAPTVGHSRVLVVDDHASQRALLRALLAPHGHAVEEAASGPEALRCIARRVPDAVLLDIGMDGMDGWQTARCIRAAGLTALPLIVVSGDLGAAQAHPGLCQAFVAKPVREAQLLAALNAALGWRQ